jgi:hypothetical protein
MKAPELPPSQMNVEVWDSEVQGLHQANAPYYTADQMHAFYRQGFAAGMEAAAQIAEQRAERWIRAARISPAPDTDDELRYCAAAIRAACAPK